MLQRRETVDSEEDKRLKAVPESAGIGSDQDSSHALPCSSTSTLNVPIPTPTLSYPLHPQQQQGISEPSLSKKQKQKQKQQQQKDQQKQKPQMSFSQAQVDALDAKLDVLVHRTSISYLIWFDFDAIVGYTVIALNQIIYSKLDPSTHINYLGILLGNDSSGEWRTPYQAKARANDT